MINETDISDVLGAHLEAMTDVYPIMWENKDAEFPEPPYLIYELVRMPSIDRTLNGDGEIKRGYLQVSVVGKLNEWARPNERQGDLIAARFRKTTKLDVTGGKITIMRPPFVGQGYRDGALWRLPVQIHYQAS
ncbi:phage tail terminator-like protein [Aliisedimentitalea scapharcae]|uniref:Phage tail terminator-like protein n=1 Tax=Aliisedimentitalea scapharcae TaxID=1524259 RepID=A0ABZ2XSX1_9RHOB